MIIVADIVFCFLCFGLLFRKQKIALVERKADELQKNFSINVIPMLANFLPVLMLWAIKRANGLSGVISPGSGVVR